MPDMGGMGGMGGEDGGFGGIGKKDFPFHTPFPTTKAPKELLCSQLTRNPKKK